MTSSQEQVISAIWDRVALELERSSAMCIDPDAFSSDQETRRAYWERVLGFPVHSVDVDLVRGVVTVYPMVERVQVSVSIKGP